MRQRRGWTRRYSENKGGKDWWICCAYGLWLWRTGRLMWLDIKVAEYATCSVMYIADTWVLTSSNHSTANLDRQKIPNLQMHVLNKGWHKPLLLQILLTQKCTSILLHLLVTTERIDRQIFLMQMPHNSASELALIYINLFLKKKHMCENAK